MSDYDLIDNLIRLTNDASIDEDTIDIMKDYTNSKERLAIKELCLELLKALDKIR